MGYHPIRVCWETGCSGGYSGGAVWKCQLLRDWIMAVFRAGLVSIVVSLSRSFCMVVCQVCWGWGCGHVRT